MNRKILVIFMVAIFAAPAFGQVKKSFPGVSASQLKELQAVRRSTPLPLPTWLPAGFKLEKIDKRLGAKVPIEDRILIMVYSRPVAAGKTQRFSLEAGFDGLGDLMFDATKVIQSGVGKIYLVYEPLDPDEGGKKLTNYVMTEWFDVGKTAFHYDGMYGEEDSTLAMISLADTVKILKSLKRL